MLLYIKVYRYIRERKGEKKREKGEKKRVIYKREGVASFNPTILHWR